MLLLSLEHWYLYTRVRVLAGGRAFEEEEVDDKKCLPLTEFKVLQQLRIAMLTKLYWLKFARQKDINSSILIIPSVFISSTSRPPERKERLAEAKTSDFAAGLDKQQGGTA
ncbi:hypothetical protein TcWFU_006879 [Taenia crassiceps]|uniref:Uncharacterized protein n=1 Tax=Taenia crassiceps TaxID=6207 RepID=A0ABR4QBD6_9CEST